MTDLAGVWRFAFLALVVTDWLTLVVDQEVAVVTEFALVWSRAVFTLFDETWDTFSFDIRVTWLTNGTDSWKLTFQTVCVTNLDALVVDQLESIFAFYTGIVLLTDFAVVDIALDALSFD